MSVRFLLIAAMMLALGVVTEGRALAGEPSEPPAPLVPDAEELTPTEAFIAENRKHRPPPWKVSSTFYVGAGATALRLLDLPFYGAQASAGLSAEVTEHLSFGGGGTYVRAETPNGLLMQTGGLELTLALVFGSARMGIGPRFTLLGVTRETGGDAIMRVGVGGHALVSVDVMRIGDRGGLFLAVKPSLAKIGPAGLVEVDFALGARF